MTCPKSMETDGCGIRSAVSRFRHPLAFIALVAAGMGSAHASDYQGTISGVWQLGARVYVYVESGSFGTDACGSGRTFLLTHFDPSTATGKAQLAMALSAQLGGRHVYVSGQGDCTTSGTPNGHASETMFGIKVE